MNIFYLHSDPKTCAQYHVDRHCNKMITEYAQLLSTAHRLIDGKQSVALSKSGRRQQVWTLDDPEMQQNVYKATHVNHPSAKWARHCAMNYTWLMELWFCLMDEYTHRYGKHHACERLIPYLCQLPKKISTAYPFCHRGEQCPTSTNCLKPPRIMQLNHIAPIILVPSSIF